MAGGSTYVAFRPVGGTRSSLQPYKATVLQRLCFSGGKRLSEDRSSQNSLPSTAQSPLRNRIASPKSERLPHQLSRKTPHRPPRSLARCIFAAYWPDQGNPSVSAPPHNDPYAKFSSPPRHPQSRHRSRPPITKSAIQNARLPVLSANSARCRNESKTAISMGRVFPLRRMVRYQCEGGCK
jgi:hypothetical protein